MNLVIVALIERMKLGFVLLAVLSAGLLCARPARAGTSIIQSTCPVVIAQPGNYTLDSDVGPCLPGVDGIDITSSNVTLHLNGHTISSSTCNNSDGIHVLGPSPVLPISMVRILGPGTLIDFGNNGAAGSFGPYGGFLAENSAGSFVKFTTATTTAVCSGQLTVGFGLQASTSMWKLDSNVVNEPPSDGIGLNGAGDNDLVRNQVNDTILLGNSSNNTIINNFASDDRVGMRCFLRVPITSLMPIQRTTMNLTA